MTVMMMDSGMIKQIAESLVTVAGHAYAPVAPFIGLLGAFVTGSNTNSNIIFGNLQEIAAISIGQSAAVMCAVQSIGASIGGAIGPTTVSLGATAAHMQGQESKIYRNNLVPILLISLILGIANYILNR
jgi:lactate permease